MLQKLSFLFFVASVIGNAAASEQKWDYHSAEYGVNTWPKHFPTCGGTSQSPININNPTYSYLGNIWFTNYGAIPSNVQIEAKNNGHSYGVSFTGYTDSSSPKITYGGLPGVFKLVGLHFHWGSDDSQGSEHRVNNMAFPAELHFVHLNTKYSSVAEGVKHGDGLAVLSVLLRRGRHNYNYNFLNRAAQQVPYPGNTAKIAVSSLAGLLPYDKSFYRYQGSLTTPKCQQVVTWTVFANTVEISEAQLNALRGMKYRDPVNHQFKQLVNNYRPTQPLNGRRVLANFRSNNHGQYGGGHYGGGHHGGGHHGGGHHGGGHHGGGHHGGGRHGGGHHGGGRHGGGHHGGGHHGGGHHGGGRHGGGHHGGGRHGGGHHGGRHHGYGK